MVLAAKQKQEVIGKFQDHTSDTGSADVQIALLTARIEQLNQHFDKHSKDFTSRQGLLKLVGRRRKLLAYVKRTEPEQYKKLLETLNLRK
ncbi:MAG: 30S ribosomal protein S15 [Deltaproteobacteria bacterium RIFCSPLOWO2_02_FULL_44_10]|nr:MAG: 30S ribosomal protein S15 [Deltaproteobacteria bacterium RIFCSPHIGHO2_02_FULL_44_16]OGQ45906.1 MAG: 30S ribosomal protein S15 [Deltaproteobacteria bacterium RIFCSPLOWO2_02_FULL_44_10]